jgi:putative IMPACT (imprinted ancient) family translation regulator
VSRYFGGVKLGYGGLVKAYSETAKEAIENGKIIEKYEMECIVMELPYTMLNITRKILLEKNAKIIKEDYADNVIITVNLKKDSIKTVIDKLTNATKGRIKIQILDCNNQTP